jgi:hypothetical protein
VRLQLSHNLLGYLVDPSTGVAALVTFGSWHNPHLLAPIFAGRTSHPWHFLRYYQRAILEFGAVGRLTEDVQLHGDFWER